VRWLFLFVIVMLAEVLPQTARAQTDPAVLRAADAILDYAVELHCKRISDAQMILLESQRTETRAFVAANTRDGIAALERMSPTIERLALDADCSGLDATIRMQKLNTLRSTAYIYASLILDLQRTIPYATNLTTLAEKADAIHRVMADIESRTSLGLAIPRLAALMGNTLLDLCQERKTVRWTNGERPCPTPKVGKAEVAYGAMIVRNIETYIAADDTPLPPAIASQWTTNLNGDTCQIATKVGNASLDGKTEKASRIGFFEFSIVTDIAASSIKGGQGAGPTRLTLEGYTSINGLAALQFKKLRLSSPTPNGAAVNLANPGPEMTVGKLKITTVFAADGLEADSHSAARSTLPGSAAMDPGLFLLVLLLDEPHLRLNSPSQGLEIDADLSDLAKILKSTSTLRQATAQCWP
jgi:hypothetical protein